MPVMYGEDLVELQRPADLREVFWSLGARGMASILLSQRCWSLPAAASRSSSSFSFASFTRRYQKKMAKPAKMIHSAA